MPATFPSLAGLDFSLRSQGLRVVSEQPVLVEKGSLDSTVLCATPPRHRICSPVEGTQYTKDETQKREGIKKKKVQKTVCTRSLLRDQSDAPVINQPSDNEECEHLRYHLILL